MKTIEQMIEEIREKVVLANNPECKTYEEALKIEGCQRDSLVLVTNERISTYRAVTTYYEYRSIPHPYDTIAKILGLPLTLERVLVALQTKHLELGKKYPDYTWLCFSGYLITYLCVRNGELSAGDIQINWQPNKTLDNQFETTIKSIYEILCLT